MQVTDRLASCAVTGAGYIALGSAIGNLFTDSVQLAGALRSASQSAGASDVPSSAATVATFSHYLHECKLAEVMPSAVELSICCQNMPRSKSARYLCNHRDSARVHVARPTAETM